MLTPQDVSMARFERSFRGYSTDSVDEFLNKVVKQLEEHEKTIASQQAELEELKAERKTMQKDLRAYEADANILKSALINAQRMGENVIREANQKSEDIIHRANLRSDDIIHDANDLLQRATVRAEEMINEAEEQRDAEMQEYDRIRQEVTRFKADVLNLYRSHVESLSRLPEYQPPVEELVEETVPQEQPAPVAEPAPVEEPVEEQEDFWSKDESELKVEMPRPAAEMSETDYAAFQGIQFSE